MRSLSFHCCRLYGFWYCHSLLSFKSLFKGVSRYSKEIFAQLVSIMNALHTSNNPSPGMPICCAISVAPLPPLLVFRLEVGGSIFMAWVVAGAPVCAASEETESL